MRVTISQSNTSGNQSRRRVSSWRTVLASAPIPSRTRPDPAATADPTGRRAGGPGEREVAIHTTLPRHRDPTPVGAARPAYQTGPMDWSAAAAMLGDLLHPFS